MPANMDLWETYKTKLGQGETPKQGKAIAQQFYVENREEMDAGGSVAWQHDKNPDEVSALQSLMTIWAVDPEFFRCEIQQEGEIPVNTSGLTLDAQSLMSRTSQMKRGQIPEDSQYQTCFIDSSDQVLWWMVTAFQSDLTGWVVDYGTWPNQGREVFFKRDLAQTISQQLPGSSWEEAFVYAHNSLESYLLDAFPELDLILKDASDGGQMSLIRGQIAASQNRHRLRMAKGFAPKPGRKPVHLWGEARDKAGTGWVEKRSEAVAHVQFDANIMKTTAARRLLTVRGAPSSVLLPGVGENQNRLLAEHMTAETPKALAYDGASGVAWELKPGRDNDWWDCFVGTITAACVAGCKLTSEAAVKKEIRTFTLPGSR
jgi:hypothetical protein